MRMANILILPILLIPFVHAYAGHPFTLFTPDQIPLLHAKMTDGHGMDDSAWVRTTSLAIGYLARTDADVGGDRYSLPVRMQELGSVYWIDENNPQRIAIRDKCKTATIYAAQNLLPGGASDPLISDALTLFGITYGYDLCFDAATGQEQTIVKTAIENYLTYFRANGYIPSGEYGNKNFGTAGSALIASMALIKDRQNSQIADEMFVAGDNAVVQGIATIIDVNGSYTEGVNYFGKASEGIVYASIARKNYDGTDYFASERLKNVIVWLSFSLLPEGDGRHLNFNDGSSSPLTFTAFYNHYMAYAMTAYQTPMAAYIYANYPQQNYPNPVLASLFIQDIPPGDPAAIYPHQIFAASQGAYIYRSGWQLGPDSRDVHFSFSSGKFYGGHNQEDRNSFALSGYRDRLIVDTGDSGGGGGCGDPASITEGHNLILIDGLGMERANSGCGIDGYIRGSLIAEGSFADFLHGDAREAYIKNSPLNDAWGWCDNQDTCPHPTVMERSDRYIFVVKSSDIPPYIVLADDTRKDAAPHAYTFNLHTEYNERTPLEKNTWSAGQNPLRVIGQNGGRLDVFVANPQFSSLTVNSALYNTAVNGDPLGNSDGNNMRLSLGITAADPQWFMILFPYDSQVTPPTYTPLTLSQGKGVALAFPSATDTVYYSPSAIIQGTDVSGTAKTAVIRESGGNIVKFAFSYASQFTKGREIIRVTGQPAHLTSDGQTLWVSSSANSYRVYGPAITRAYAGSQGMPVYVAGDYRLATMTPPPACAGQNGYTCAAYETCTGQWLFARDTDTCCTIACEAASAPPSITEVRATAFDNSALIAWTTDIPSDSQVEYGLTAAYGQATILDPAEATSHSVDVIDLAPNTLYHYRVKSCIFGTLCAYSADGEFTTAPSACAAAGGQCLRSCDNLLDCTPSGNTCTGNLQCCTGACTCLGTPPDSNCDMIIENSELQDSLNKWISGDISLPELIAIIEWWKNPNPN